MPALPQQIAMERLGSLPGWKIESKELVKIFTFNDFLGSIAFVNQIAKLAEDAAHHPDIDIRYNRVRIALTTHDAGGLTEKDFALAGKIEKLV